MLAGRENNRKITNRILDGYSIKGIIDLVIENEEHKWLKF